MNEPLPNLRNEPEPERLPWSSGRPAADQESAGDAGKGGSENPPLQNSPGAQLSLWDHGSDGGRRDDSGEPPHGCPPGAPRFDTPWTFRDLLLFVLFAISTTLLVLSALGVLLAALRGGRPTLPESQWTPYAVVLQVALEALWLLFVYLLVTRKYQRPFWSSMHWFGLHGREPSFFFSGVGLAIFVQLYSALFPPERHMPIEDWFTNARSAYIVALFGICIAPFAEEMIFRGFFYPVFEKRWGLTAAVAITALFFAVMHASQLGWSPREVGVIFIVGATLSYARGKTRSLLSSYLVHLGYNTALFAMLYISTNQFRTL